MATSNTYTDSYLKNLVTEDLEDRSLEDVNAINPKFPEPWKTKLVVCRAYVLTCVENCKAQDDLFSVKLKAYESEWKLLLKNGTDAYNALTTTTNSYSFLSIPLERA